MATLYRAETTLQDILNMSVGDELQLAGGGDLPEYTEDDAGKALQVNQAGTGLEWGPGVPEYTSSDVGKVLTIGETPVETVIIPEQTVTVVDSSVTLENTDLGSLTVGDSITVNINGIDYTDTWSAIGVDCAVNTNLTCNISPNGIFNAYNPKTSEVVAGQYTVSCGIEDDPVVSPVWQTDAYVFDATTAKGTISSEVTYAEIEAAYDNGMKPIVLRVLINDNVFGLCPLIGKDATSFSFYSLSYVGSGLIIDRYYVTNADVWNHNYMEITGTWS